MATFTFPAMLDALRTQLVARTHLTGDRECAVYTAPIPQGTPHPRKAVVFVGAEDLLDPAGIGPPSQTVQKEAYTVQGTVGGFDPRPSEDGAKAARDNCLAVLEELNQQLREDCTVNGTVESARLGTVDWAQGLEGDQGRYCAADFTLVVKARIAATPAGSWT